MTSACTYPNTICIYHYVLTLNRSSSYPMYSTMYLNNYSCARAKSTVDKCYSHTSSMHDKRLTM